MEMKDVDLVMKFPARQILGLNREAQHKMDRKMVKEREGRRYHWLCWTRQKEKVKKT